MEDPIIIDLGKKKRKLVRRLRKGRGELMDDVEDCVQELLTAGAIKEGAQPVIMVVREKAASRRRGLLF